MKLAGKNRIACSGSIKKHNLRNHLSHMIIIGSGDKADTFPTLPSSINFFILTEGTINKNTLLIELKAGSILRVSPRK